MRTLRILFLGCCLWGCGKTGNDTQVTTPAVTDVKSTTVPGAAKAENIAPGGIMPDALVIDADILYPFSEGYAVIEKGSGQALIDGTGNVLLPYNQYIFGTMKAAYWEENGRFHPGWDWPGFHRGICLVGTRSQNQYGSDIVLWGGINPEQQVVIPFQHTGFEKQSGDHLFFRGGNSETICYNRRGGRVNYPQRLDQGYDRSRRDILRDSQYFYGTDSIMIVSSYLNGVGYRHGLCTFDGKPVTNMAYEQIELFSEGLAAFMQRDDFGKTRWGFMNTKGEIVIPATYTNKPGSFHCGVALVEPSDKSTFSYAFINKKGEVTIPLTDNDGWSRYALEFRNGLIANQRRNGYMDTNGRFYSLDIIKGSFTDPVTGLMITNIHNSKVFTGRENSHFRPDQILFRHNEKIGLADINGNLLVPPVFEELSLFDPVSGLASAVFHDPLNGRKTEGYITTKGVFKLIKSNSTRW